MKSKNYNPCLESPEAQANGGQVKPIIYNLVVIVGPTSSGKSELAVSLAKKFNGEIISCDSRQVYKGMNIGTGKISGHWYKKYPKSYILHPILVYKSIPHHCIDFVSPNRRYSVAQFKKQANKAIKNILNRGKLPILCGGTAQYVDAVVFNQTLPEVKPNLKLRNKLEKQSVGKLFKKLMKLDKVRAESIDRFNKRRLIRALEIVLTTGKPVTPLSAFGEGRGEVKNSNYSTLWLGIKTDQEILYKKIEKRLKERFAQGMIKEVQHLHSPSFKRRVRPAVSLPFSKGEVGRGLSWKKLESFGLEYKYISQFLQKYPNYSLPLRGRVRASPALDAGEGWNEMFTQLLFAIKHYSKRQLTWWKRNKEINWIKNKTESEKLIKKFLYSKS
jgi:tRNA dimethylallyltransferase